MKKKGLMYFLLPWIISICNVARSQPCPTVISKGVFTAACEAVVGSTCSFLCEAGYIRNTSVSELTCQTSTEWSADLTSLCLRPDGQQCPYYIRRGDLNLTCIREPGQTCSFTCDEGYQPSISPPTIACGSKLVWDHNPARLCQECDTQIDHGIVLGCDVLNIPCYYDCQKGYQKDDNVRFLVCSTSGQMVSWLTNSLVSAKDLCTPKPCPIVISKGAFSAECEGVVGSTCSFSCEEGYMRNTSLSELTCQTSLEWSLDLRSLCLRPDGQQCPYFIPRGDLSLTCIREPDQTCNFTCDEGYRPSISPPTIACGSNLEWNHNTESLCQEINCSNVFKGGYVPETCGRKYKARCFEYQCNPGYVRLSSLSYVICDDSGNWNDPDGKSSPCFRSGESGNGNIGSIVGIIIGTLLAGLIIFALCIGLIAKCSGARKSQRRGSGHVGSRCLRPSENPVRNVNTIRQQHDADGMGSVSSFDSPSYNSLYVQPYVQRISTINNSCKYHGPPPSYSSIPHKESLPTYEEVVTDPSRFNLYITYL